MLNILIPMGGKNTFNEDEFQYPKPLIEINGKLLIERVVNFMEQIDAEKRYIFVVNSNDCRRYHLDNILALITNYKCELIRLEKPTSGAACSALMAIEQINNDSQLIISNCDHIIDYDLNTVFKQFQKRSIDAGTICFESIHPKWSFVRLDEKGKIIEAAEKCPLSKKAIAGFYYFKRGSDFVEAAMQMIKKDANVDGNYYIAPAMNELILKNMNLEMFEIPISCYYNFYSPHIIKEYEKHANGKAE